MNYVRSPYHGRGAEWITVKTEETSDTKFNADDHMDSSTVNDMDTNNKDSDFHQLSEFIPWVIDALRGMGRVNDFISVLQAISTRQLQVNIVLSQKQRGRQGDSPGIHVGDVEVCLC